MRELTYYVACSVDGFIAHADGSHGGFSQEPDYLASIFADFPETVPSHLREVVGIAPDTEHKWFDTVLMGRKTYEIGLQEGVTSPYAHLKQYLFSHSIKESPDQNVTLVADQAIELVTSLKNEAGQGIWLCGGGQLASSLLMHRLIDRLILKVNPFLIGSGIPLFAAGIQPTALELTQRQIYDNGVLLLYYSLI